MRNEDANAGACPENRAGRPAEKAAWNSILTAVTEA
jgi:hypothetical protein